MGLPVFVALHDGDDGGLREDGVADGVEADDGLAGLGVGASFGYGSPRMAD